ncbi:hypothetical protein IAT38_007116 [Cryptococcus sp. DSM 104549]
MYDHLCKVYGGMEESALKGLIRVWKEMRLKPSPTAQEMRSHERLFWDRRGDIIEHAVRDDITAQEEIEYFLLSSAVEKERDPVLLEHSRLGHVGDAKLIRLHRAGYTHLPLTEKAIRESRVLTDCAACASHRSTRHSFPDTSPRAEHPGELVHCDIIGDFDVSRTGRKYALVMLDDYSKVTLIEPLAHKTGVVPVMEKFINLLECQFGNRVRWIRSDNGTEFLSGEGQALYKRKGIIHQLSTRHTGALNGVCERHIRIMKEMTKAMLNAAGMTHGYWELVLRYAAVVWMKISRGRDGIDAWERLTGRKTKGKEIMEFGEECWVHITQEMRGKHSFTTPTAERGRFVGVGEGETGMFVLLERNGQVIRSRDVRTARGSLSWSEDHQRPTEIRRASEM